MASMDSYVDWTGCELVERVPGKVSGRPIVRGTRILAGPVDHGDTAVDRVCPFATRAAHAVRVLFDHIRQA